MAWVRRRSALDLERTRRRSVNLVPPTEPVTEPTLPIREAAALLGVSAHTLRYSEREGLLGVPRTAGGERLYSEAELGRLRFLRHLHSKAVRRHTYCLSGRTFTEKFLSVCLSFASRGRPTG